VSMHRAHENHNTAFPPSPSFPSNPKLCVDFARVMKEEKLPLSMNK